MRRLVTLIAALCLLALPSAALAQNAGDEQYSDPFGEAQEEESNSQGSDGQTDNGGTDNGGTQESTQTDETFAESEPAQTAAPTLPRTGLPALLVAGSGALLLAGGTTLRRRTS